MQNQGIHHRFSESTDLEKKELEEVQLPMYNKLSIQNKYFVIIIKNRLNTTMSKIFFIIKHDTKNKLLMIINYFKYNKIIIIIFC